MNFVDLKLKLLKYKKDGDQLRAGVLSYLISQIQNKEIELRVEKREINEEDMFKVLRKEVKNQIQAIEMYKQGNRSDLVEKSEREVEILREIAKEFSFELDL